MLTHNFKADIALYRAVLAAGFALSKIESVQTDDGACWATVLTHQKKPLVRASNGGHGGPSEIAQLVDKGGRYHDLSPVQAEVDKLLAIPEVASRLRSERIELEEGTWHYAVERIHKERTEAGENVTVEQVREQLQAESTAKIEAIKTGPLPSDEETVADFIGELTDIHQTIGRFRRAAKTKVGWFKKGATDGSFYEIKGVDSPELRERIKAKYAVDFDGFIADEIAGL
ncbi:hypothetical protein [Ottowia sp.]|uniref:hypothetical protein n=1 Tax=Ottowia sp. TaxID=1898956 RepID=UPI0025D19E7F|nr:hypothetical protein [Ottowia sp.]MBK6616560.1 hypothetical protein [Ottowia sp.]